MSGLNGGWAPPTVRRPRSWWIESSRRAAHSLLLVLTACGPAARDTEPPAPPPRISVEASEHDFGEIEQGTRIEHAFNVANHGGVALTIDKMRSGCGCEASMEAERVVPPGTTTRIHVRCATTTSFGRQRRTVSIYSNDPVTPVAIVRLVGSVRGAAALAPSRFYVGRVHRGERVGRDGLVRWPTLADPPQLVADVDAPFRVEVALPAAGSDRGSFTVVMKDDAALGPITGAVHLRRAEGRSLRTVPVIGEIVPDISIVPPRVELAPLNATVTHTAAVMVHNAGPRAVRITSVEWIPGTAVMETLEAGERYRVVLKTERPATEESELVVRTDHPEQPLLRVPIHQPSTGGR